jgi:hypothetical protein
MTAARNADSAEETGSESRSSPEMLAAGRSATAGNGMGKRNWGSGGRDGTGRGGKRRAARDRAWSGEEAAAGDGEK